MQSRRWGGGAGAGESAGAAKVFHHGPPLCLQAAYPCPWLVTDICSLSFWRGDICYFICNLFTERFFIPSWDSIDFQLVYFSKSDVVISNNHCFILFIQMFLGGAIQ